MKTLFKSIKYMLAAIAISILAIPLPSTYASCHVSATVNTNYCNINQIIEFSITVSTNINDNCSILTPAPSHISAFTGNFLFLQQKPDITTSNTNKIYRWQIIPGHSGIVEIPAIPVIFINRISGGKCKLSTAPIPLQINPGTQEQLNTVASIRTGNNPASHEFIPSSIFNTPIKTPLQKYLWEKANTETVTAHTSQEYDSSINSYRQLIKSGVHNGIIYYNLGTIMLKANLPESALKNFHRAIQYIGNKKYIRHNIEYAKNILKTDGQPVNVNPTNILFPWYFYLSINDKIYLSLIFMALTIFAAIYFGSNRKYIIIISATAAALLLSSVIISIINETAARNIENALPEISAVPEQKNKTDNYPPCNEAKDICSDIRTTKAITANNAKNPVENSTNKIISVTISTDNNHPYKNQYFNLKLTITAKKPLGQEITIENMPTKDTAELTPFRELPTQYIGDNEIHSYTCRARAVVPLLLQPVITTTYHDNSKVYSTTATSTPLRINTVQLPKPPVNFSGAVGVFSIDVKRYPSSPTKQELVTITTKISGNGYIPKDFIQQITSASGYIIYKPEKIAPHKYRQLFAPLPNAGQYKIPEIEFIYFNPLLKKYEKK